MSQARPFHTLMLGISCVALAACASDSDRYPSLELRDAERVTGVFQPAAAAPTPAPLPDAKLSAVEQALEQAQAAHVQFLAGKAEARERVLGAQGSAVASSAWAAAQVALADLDARRSLSAIALADLDLLYTDSSLSFEELAAIAEAREQVLALIREEDLVLAELRASI